MSRPYRADLAYIHDAGHGVFARGAVAWIIGMLRRAEITDGRIVELGCGTGIMTQELTSAGYDVLGIDIAPDMIALAREKAPQAEFRIESFLSAEIPPCRTVLAVGEVFNYLFDESNSLERLEELLERCFAALEPGGLLIFDVLEPDQLTGARAVKNWRDGDDWSVMVKTTENPEDHTLTRHIVSYRKVGELYRRDVEVHHQQLWPRKVLAARLRQIGFRVRTCGGYGEPRLKRHAVFLARKPLT